MEGDDDVGRMLSSMWPDRAERETVRKELERYGGLPHEREEERVKLAILKLCDGQADRVAGLVAAAKRDYRDVLMWAESPAEGQALWALRPDLTGEQRARLAEVRKQDREQYRKWRKE